MTVVAECVETEEQLQFISAAGCELVQGYLLGRPAAPEAVAGLVASFTKDAVTQALAA